MKKNVTYRLDSEPHLTVTHDYQTDLICLQERDLEEEEEEEPREQITLTVGAANELLEILTDIVS